MAQKEISETVFDKLRLMSPGQFHEVAWRHVHDAVLETPRMFQIWAYKQVINVAGVNRNLSKYMKDQCSKCLSCNVQEENCHHMTYCNAEVRFKTLLGTIQMLDDWMKRVGTHDMIRICLAKYARKRGNETLRQITWVKVVSCMSLPSHWIKSAEEDTQKACYLRRSWNYKLDSLRRLQGQ